MIEHRPPGVVLMPQRLWEDRETCRGVFLWNLLVRLAADEETVSMPVSTIATVLGKSPATVVRHAGVLADAGLLEYTPGRGRGGVSLWRPLGRATAEDVAKAQAEHDGPVYR